MSPLQLSICLTLATVIAINVNPIPPCKSQNIPFNMAFKACHSLFIPFNGCLSLRVKVLQWSPKQGPLSTTSCLISYPSMLSSQATFASWCFVDMTSDLWAPGLSIYCSLTPNSFSSGLCTKHTSSENPSITILIEIATSLPTSYSLPFPYSVFTP